MNPRAPRAISELIVNALPELRERLVEEGIRRSWPAVVGADGARRSRPQRLTNGLLEIAVDNSPWLHELTLRAPDLTTRVRAQFAAITSLRFVLTPVARDATSVSPATERRRRALAPEEKRDSEIAVAPTGDEPIRDSAGCLLPTSRRSLGVVTLMALAAGCAGQGPVAAVNGDEPPRRTRFVAPPETSDAYYHYSIAQMM